VYNKVFLFFFHWKVIHVYATLVNLFCFFEKAMFATTQAVILPAVVVVVVVWYNNSSSSKGLRRRKRKWLEAGSCCG
jgi:hypothetical protein